MHLLGLRFLDIQAMENQDPNNVRIITTLGHVDHGKTTLMDALLAAKHHIGTYGWKDKIPG